MQRLEIVRITPSGEEVSPSAIRQISFTFNRPVISLGRMERENSEIPHHFTPDIACKWRWLNTSTLVCHLSKSVLLQPATRYTVTIEPGIKAEDGAVISKTIVHTFTTEIPKANYGVFGEWKSPVLPEISVYFNLPVTKKSVAKHVYFLVEKKHRIAAVIEEDKYHHGRVWKVQPKKAFQYEQQIELMVESGIESTTGAITSLQAKTLVSFDTFERKFRFLGFECQDNEKGKITIPADIQDSGNPKRCNPAKGFKLFFSSPFSEKELLANLKISPYSSHVGKDKIFVYYGTTHRKGQQYEAEIRQSLPPFQKIEIQLDKGMKDIFGNHLAKPSVIWFETDHLTPGFELKSHDIVLEKNAEYDHSIIVRNIDKIKLKYTTITASGKSEHINSITPDLPMDEAHRIPLPIRELLPFPLNTLPVTSESHDQLLDIASASTNRVSGIIAGNIEIFPQTERYSNDRFSAQVTPFNVQVKKGRFNTLVWVTDFVTGKPVEGVDVDFFSSDLFRIPESKPVRSATTNFEGIVVIDYSKSPYAESAFVVRCRKGDDLAFVPLDSHRYRIPEGLTGRAGQRKSSHQLHIWGTTAQGVYKAGDKVQFKIYVRGQSATRFIPAPKSFYSLKIIDPKGNNIYSREKVALNEFGAMDGEFDLPESATTGWYSATLVANFQKKVVDIPLRFLVADFTPAAFRVTHRLDASLYQPGEILKVRTEAKLHAGGPFKEATTRINVLFTVKDFHPEQYIARDFVFTNLETYPRQEDFDDDSFGKHPYSIHQSEGKLDQEGVLETDFQLPELNELYGTITVESAVMDDRGKFVTVRKNAVYAGRNRYAGIRVNDWLLKTGRPTKVELVILDENNIPIKGEKIAVSISHSEIDWENFKQVEQRKILSGEKTGSFVFTPRKTGIYRIKAEVIDTNGRHHSAWIQRWAIGEGVIISDSTATRKLDIFPEKKAYTVGETATYMVINPYPGTKALISVERFGIIQSWTQMFNKSAEMVKVKITPELFPGFYLSVVAIKGRTNEKPTLNDLDPGRPDFRMGYVETKVSDLGKRLTVKIESDKEKYRPGEQITLNLKVRQGRSKPKKPVELTVAVLDEAVFDLIKGGEDYFDLEKGMLFLDKLEVFNTNLIMRFLPKLKLGKIRWSPYDETTQPDMPRQKSMGAEIEFEEIEESGEHAQKGQAKTMREVANYLAYWNSSLITDKDGKAKIEFEAPHNLTGWRIIVLATDPKDVMGVSSSRFIVDKEIELRSLLPNQVTQGDSFMAGFSVMNRTEKQRKITVTIKSKGSLEDSGVLQKQIITAPFERQMVWMPIQTNKPGELTFAVMAKDGDNADGLIHRLVVRQRSSIHTAANYGSFESGEIEEKIVFPKEIHGDIGGIDVVISPTVIGNLEGAFEYLRDYPYGCWEQKITKGLMAAHFQNLKAYISTEFQWEQSTKLPQKSLDLATNYQASNGGFGYYIGENKRVRPYLSAYTALAFNWLQKSGYRVPKEVEDKLHRYLLNFLQGKERPAFYTDGMEYTVKAVAMAALSEHGKVTKAMLEKFAEKAFEMSLFGKAHYLIALLNTPGTDLLQHKVMDSLLTFSKQTGGKFLFNEKIESAYAGILTSTLRDNGAVLSAIVRYAETERGRQLVGDIPFKLVRTITQSRGNRFRWENTQENLFCINALIDYSHVYEKAPLHMQVKSWFNAEPMGEATFQDFRDNPVFLEHPMQKNDPGTKAVVRLSHSGSGRTYYTTRLFYAPIELQEKATNAGIEVHREYSVERDNEWKLLQSPMNIVTGEIVRIDIYITLPAARNFVVVDDPIPGGLEAINEDLATDSVVDSAKGHFRPANGSFWFHHDWLDYGYSYWSFYHKELRHHAALFYSEYLPAGNYHLSYTAQAISPGEFTVMPLNAKEMYAPNIYGKGVSAILKVEKK